MCLTYKIFLPSTREPFSRKKKLLYALGFRFRQVTDGAYCFYTLDTLKRNERRNLFSIGKASTINLKASHHVPRSFGRAMGKYFSCAVFFDFRFVYRSFSLKLEFNFETSLLHACLLHVFIGKLTL